MLAPEVVMIGEMDADGRIGAAVVRLSYLVAVEARGGDAHSLVHAIARYGRLPFAVLIVEDFWFSDKNGMNKRSSHGISLVTILIHG